MKKMNPDIAHDLRNGLSGIYAERKRLISEMLDMSGTLDRKSKESRLIPSKIKYKLYRSLIQQVGCINRMDKQLKRIVLALRRNE